MSRGCGVWWKRLVAAALLSVLAIGVTGPTTASAKHLSGARIELYRPKSLSKTRFAMKTRSFDSQIDGTAKVYVFRGSKTKTRFWIASS